MTQTCTTNTTTIETLTEENEEFPVKIDYESFDRYQIGNGESKFDLFFQQNIIDKNYISELSNATTTQEFIAVEKKYLGLWQEELKKSIDSFQLILSDSEKESLVQTQKEWEEYMKSRFLFEDHILTDSVPMGSSSKWLFISQQREAYRERVALVKYLHYLLESDGGNQQEENLLSLRIFSECSSI